MQVDFAFLADAAVAGTDGGISAIGLGIQAISAPQFPAIRPDLSLVLRLEIHATECEREHTVEIQIWEPDGKVIEPQVKATFTPQRDPNEPTRPVTLQFVLNMRDVQFPRAGAYAVHIVVDGNHQKDISLRLIEQALPDQAQAEKPAPEQHGS